MIVKVILYRVEYYFFYVLFLSLPCLFRILIFFNELKPMREDFLYFIWQYQYFDKKNLKTEEGKKLQILDVGILNLQAGADFQLSRIELDQVEWVGSVEIHIKASDWQIHKHQHDKKYNTVVLHVVWEADKECLREDGSMIPTLELKKIVTPDLIQKFYALIASEQKIPCANQWDQVPDLQKILLLDKALSQRLEKKALQIQEILRTNKNDWEQTTYQVLLKNMGFKINSEPMEQLGRQLPLKILLKYTEKPLALEALLFGQAGFLNNEANKDAYYLSLRKEYLFLAQKHNLLDNQLSESQWLFARMRPANFPTIRLAQMASLLTEYQDFFYMILNEPIDILTQKLKAEASAYWKNHYTFDKESPKVYYKLGQTSIQNILINTIAPILTLYAIEKDTTEPMERALAILEKIPAENNRILRFWKEIGLEVKTAFDSQALLEQYHSYCNLKKCLNCSVGAFLLKKNVV
jgi:Protein of unknown function (DUF2851)